MDIWSEFISEDDNDKKIIFSLLIFEMKETEFAKKRHELNSRI